MKKNFILLSAFLLIFVSAMIKNMIINAPLKRAAAVSSSQDFKTDKNPFIQEFCHKAFPTADICVKSEALPPFYYALKNKTHASPDQTLGYLLFTKDFAPEISGYSGIIEMVLAVSLEGEILNASILSHTETPMYTVDIHELIQQFEGKRITEVFKLNTNIDGITRATVTSQAVVDSINKSLARLSAILAKTPEPPTRGQDETLAIDQIIIPLLLFLFSILSLYWPGINLRWKIMLISLLYLGFLKSSMLSIVPIINIGLLQFPSFINAPLFYVLIGTTLLTLLIWGNLYCGYICPFSAIEEALSQIFYKLNSYTGKADKKLFQKARMAKYAILFIAVSAGLFWRNSHIATIEAFILFFSGNATSLGWAFVISILFFSAFYRRFWCRFFCPIGAFNGMTASFSRYKIRVNKETCIQCRQCVTICPMDALEIKDKKISIDHSQCILCSKCLKRCPLKSIEYK